MVTMAKGLVLDAEMGPLEVLISLRHVGGRGLQQL